MVKVPVATATVELTLRVTGAEMVPALPPVMSWAIGPRPLRVRAPGVPPELEIVLLTVMSPVAVMPLVLVSMVMFVELSSRLATVTLEELTVTVPVPELESKCTLVVATGMLPAPGVPLLVVAQWLVASDQLPVPPTQ